MRELCGECPYFGSDCYGEDGCLVEEEGEQGDFRFGDEDWIIDPDMGDH